MWCFEKIVKFISKNAYIMVAMKGKNFCRSTKAAFLLILANLAQVRPEAPIIKYTENPVTVVVLVPIFQFQVGAVTIISAYLILMGKLAITFGCAALVFTLLNNGPSFGLPFVFTQEELNCCCADEAFANDRYGCAEHSGTCSDARFTTKDACLGAGTCYALDGTAVNITVMADNQSSLVDPRYPYGCINQTSALLRDDVPLDCVVMELRLRSDVRLSPWPFTNVVNASVPTVMNSTTNLTHLQFTKQGTCVSHGICGTPGPPSGRDLNYTTEVDCATCQDNPAWRSTWKDPCSAYAVDRRSHQFCDSDASASGMKAEDVLACPLACDTCPDTFPLWTNNTWVPQTPEPVWTPAVWEDEERVLLTSPVRRA
jgi:hypothetical protein